MGRLKKHIKDNRILYRMIAIYTMVCMVVIILVTTAIYRGFSREIRNEIYRYQVQALKQVSNTVSFRAEYANYLMVQVKSGQQTSKLFYSSDQDVVMDAIKDISELRNATKQLYSVYIYNEHDGRIYSSGENMISAISPVEGFGDKGFVEILERVADYPKYTPFLRQISIESPNGTSHQMYVYTYLLYDSYSSGGIRNIVAFNFHIGWIKDALDYISADGKNKTESIWVVNKERQVMYSNAGNYIGTYMDHEILPDEVLEGKDGYLITGSGNDKKMLVYASPSDSGYEEWIFLSWIDYSALMGPLDRVIKLIYIVCVTAILCSLLLIARLSIVLYKPVRLMLDRTKVLESERKARQKQEGIQFLRRLFLGNVQDDLMVIQKEFAKYQIQGETEGDIRMLCVSVDYLNSYFRRVGSEIEAVDGEIENVLIKCCKAYHENAICIKMQNGVWGICVPAEEGEEYESLFGEMNRALAPMDVTVSMAVSSVGHSARDIPYLYSEVVDVSSYLYLWGRNKVITDEDIQKQGQKKFEYPHEIEKKFLGLLFGGKNEEATESFKEFVEAISMYTVEEIKLSFMFLAYAVKNTSQKTMAETSSILVEFDQFYKKLQSVETIDEVENMFLNLIEEITEKLQFYSRERYLKLIDQVKAYVEENYKDITLSVNQVSDYVNMSAAYLGRVFKQVAGTTFTEYLTKYRLDAACKLLKETNMTVNEISDEVGFTNSSYFHIIFKKNMNCTPNQYRKQ